MSLRSTTYVLDDEMPFEPAGVAGMIVYNGLIMNNRRAPDMYLIDRVTGLDGADVRASSEPRSDRDGENAADSLYGGRLITMRGKIYAGNYFTMKRMWSQLCDAFDDLQDHWLEFLWNDWPEDFSGPWSNDYTFDAGTIAALVTGTGLVFSDTTLRRLVLKQRTYVDGSGFVHWINGSAGPSTSKVGMIARRTSAMTYIEVVYQSSQIKINSVVAGVSTTLATLAWVATTASTNYWLAMRFEGSTVIAEGWTVQPSESGTPSVSTSASMPSLLGAGIEGMSGVEIQGSSGSVPYPVTIIDSMFEKRNPGDTMIICRKGSKNEGDDFVDERGRFCKDFLLTLRSGESSFVSRKLSTQTLVVQNAWLVFPGGGGGLIFPADGSGLRFGQPLGSVTNLGRSPADPVVRIHGPCVNPGLYCYDSDTLVSLLTTIAGGAYVDVDCEQRKITHSDGTDLRPTLHPESNWLSLLGGSNSLLFGAESFTAGTTSVDFIFRHTSR